MKTPSFYDTVTAAIRDFTLHGYDDKERLAYWTERLKKAASENMVSDVVLKATMQKNLSRIYDSLVLRGGILTKHKGVERFTLEHVKPKLRAELDRRIVAAANLIKLNREEAIQNTLLRFSGWATSIPAGGSKTVNKTEEKQKVRKSLRQLPFEERRVLIDQGHKFVSSLNSILAKDANAIAAEWHSHWQQLNYNYRRDHKERDKKVYAIRGNWAIKAGLMHANENGYTDQITEPGEEVFCRCYYRYIYNLRDLPDDMLTEKGAIALKEVA